MASATKLLFRRLLFPNFVSQSLLACLPSNVMQGKRAPVAGSTDEALMARLGEVIQGMKEDFMVVHFREPCSFCRKYLSNEPRCGAGAWQSLSCVHASVV